MTRANLGSIAIFLLLNLTSCSSKPVANEHAPTPAPTSEGPSQNKPDLPAPTPETKMEQEQGIGTLQIAKGSVQIKTASGLVPAKAGQTVHTRDEILTEKDAHAKIVMLDQNEIELSAGSQVVIEHYETNAKGHKNVMLNLLYGKIRSLVRQKYDGVESRFHIKTRTAVAGVRGTDFLVSFNPTNSSSQVVTFDGTVEFGTPASGKSVSVNKGQTSTAIADGAPSTPTPLNQAKLEDMSLETAVQEHPSEVTKPATQPTVKSAPTNTGVAGKVALNWLQHGNQRFVKHWLRADGQSSKDIARLKSEQHPHSIVLSCSDSRVPPEIIFDQKLGEIYVIRTLDLAVDDKTVAAVEWAHNNLGAQLLVVLNHAGCGAQASKLRADEVIAELQKRSPALHAASEKGSLMMQPAFYDLSTGVVAFKNSDK